MSPKKPAEEWLRIAAEARRQLPTPPPDAAAPGWFVTRALAERRAAARAGENAPWFVFPGLARAATVSVALALACAVVVLSTGTLEEFTDPLSVDLELEGFDLP